MFTQLKEQWQKLPRKVRTAISVTLKLALTIAAFYVLFTHPVQAGEGEKVAIYEAIVTYLPQIEARQFWFWCILAGLIKLVGVGFSAWGWHLLLKGQNIVYPFWRQIMTTWLIGRFIGTFLPSTIGLDGYTLYDAGRYSNEWERVTVAKALEKFIGVTGLFLCMLVLLPFGVGIFGERAMLMGGIVGGVASMIVLAVFLGTFRPGILQFFLRLPFPFRDRIETQVNRLDSAAGAYRDKPLLLCMVFFAKFVTHFTTAVVYVFTAMAVGVVDVQFFDVTFASSIQILGTLFSPTIAGEGAREMIQAYLLADQMGAVQSILSASLGFIAAEAATMWGGVFWLFRNARYRPAFALVDGVQVEHNAAPPEEDDTSGDGGDLVPQTHAG